MKTYRLALEPGAYARLVAGRAVQLLGIDDVNFELILSSEALRAANLRTCANPQSGRRSPPDPPQAVEFLPLSQQPGRRRR